MVSGASLAGLAGCFGGGSSPSTETGDDTPGLAGPTTRPFAEIGTSTAAREYSGYDWGLLNDAEPTNTRTIEISQVSGTISFSPLIARIPPGTTVKWENTDPNRHTITIPKLDEDTFIFTGETVERTFDEPGVYNYLCKNHSPEHLGRIVVDETLTPYPGSGTDTGSGTGTDGGAGTDTDTDTDTESG